MCKFPADVPHRPGIGCSQAIPETELSLNVMYEPGDKAEAEKRTGELVKYVSDKVLCKLK